MLYYFLSILSTLIQQIMKSNSIIGLVAAFILTLNFSVHGQQIVNHHVDFASGQQSMWGPTAGFFSIDQTINLFNVTWDVGTDDIPGVDLSSDFIFSVAGQQFGAGFDANFSGVIGSNVSLEGFTTGTVEVDYPIDVTLNMPTDLTYDPGDQVTVNTSYVVDPNWDLETLYPSAGEFKWDLYFGMAAHANATLCFFGCTTFPIIPSFNTGTITVNLVTASGNGATTGGNTGLWYLGPGSGVGASTGFPFNQLPGTAGWPYALPPASGPINQATLGSTWIPWQVHIPAFPAEIPETGFGLSGEVTIPYVITDPVLTGPDIEACGDSTYFNLNLEVFKLLGNILSYTPPPGPAVGLVLSNLSGSVDLGPATVSWNFFSASFDMNITNNQCFDFTPKVYGKFVFPVAVEYSILSPLNVVLSSGNSSIINVEIGNKIRYKFPCYYQELNITPTYSIDGNFSNHTFDVISFDFLMSAFEFGFSIPGVIVIPGFTIPELCIPIPYPCPTWSSPFRWCTTTVCTPEIVVPPIGWNGVNETWGPIWSTSIPLGSISYDWFNQSWDLAGFSQYTFAAFKMRARPMTISNTQVDVLCYGANTGSIDVTIGTTTYDPVTWTYVWTSGQITQDITGLAAGPYELMAYDSHGCQLFTGATILEPEAPLSITYVKTDVSCNGGNDGRIDILVQGGTPGYTYNWAALSGGGQVVSAEDQTTLTPGTYSVTVADSRGCTIYLEIPIGQPNPLVQVGAITHVNCFGNADGSINVDVAGGSLPYSFLWSNSATSEDILGLSGATYTLTITDGNGCTSVRPYIVTEPATSVSASAIGTNVLCKFNTTGAVNVTTVGGTPGYTYLWYNGQGVVLPYQSEDISNVPAGNYTVLITDFKGCQTQVSQFIDEPAQNLGTIATLTNINCFGASTGSINPGIYGGTVPYTYAWSNATTASIATNLPAGTLTLTVTDAALCTAVFTYVLTEPASGLSLNLTGTDILCFGDNTGAASSTVSGGTASYSYLWSNAATTPGIQNLIAGNYVLTVTDSKGCVIADNIDLLQPAAALALSTVVTDIDCYGNNNGVIDLTITGGTTPYLKAWSNSGTFVIIDTITTLAGQFADDYTVLVTDANGCQATISETITQPAAPLAITGIVDDVNCFGLNDGAVDISVTGGTLNYTYSWSNGDVTEDINGQLSGNYTVTVTDPNGCTESADYTIDQPAAPLALSTFVTDVKCNGGIDGRIQSTVTGGTAPYSYLWSNGVTTPNIISLSANTYTLTVTDAQGCTAFTGAVVNQPAQPLLVTNVMDPISCYGYSDGQITLTVAGGNAPYTFSWGNQNEILLNNPSETLSGLTVGDYFIRVKDKNGCINEQLITVTEPAPFTLEYIVADALCYGDNTGSIDITLAGGTIPYSVNWSNGQTTEDITSLTSDMYTYNVTDFNGCQLNDSIFVGEPTYIEVDYSIVEVTCIDQSDGAIYITPYGGTLPYSYLWNTGSTAQNVENLAPGLYNLTIVDGNSCSQTFDYEIYDNIEECLNIPNTFTPNGDNYNDTWVIGNIGLYPNASVKVFNKWGNEIYSSKGEYTPWDGEYNAAPLPSEVYYYIIVLGNNEENEYTGTITIIR
jgi:gliding motility-associated-like protein